MKASTLLRHAPVAGALVLAVLVNKEASAGSFGSITVSNFRISALDLRIDDGIEPAVAFVLPTTTLGNKIELQGGATPVYQYKGAIGSQPLDPISASLITPTAATNGAITTNGAAGPSTTVTLSGWAEPSTVRDDRSEYLARATLPANAMMFGNLSLTPWTLITISFDLDMNVGTTGGTKTGAELGGEFSRAIANFTLSGNNGAPSQWTHQSLEVRSSFLDGVFTGSTDHGHWTVSMSLPNYSSDVAYAYTQLSTEIWGFTYANPVPEPTSALLLVAGLALLVTRRQRPG